MSFEPDERTAQFNQAMSDGASAVMRAMLKHVKEVERHGKPQLALAVLLGGLASCAGLLAEQEDAPKGEALETLALGVVRGALRGAGRIVHANENGSLPARLDS